jgi:hypothetical protein
MPNYVYETDLAGLKASVETALVGKKVESVKLIHGKVYVEVAEKLDETDQATVATLVRTAPIKLVVKDEKVETPTKEVVDDEAKPL